MLTKKNRYRFLLFVLMSIFFVIVVVVDFHLWFDFIFFAIAIMIIIRNENNKNPFIFDKTSKNIIIMFVRNETKITFFGSQKKMFLESKKKSGIHIFFYCYCSLHHEKFLYYRFSLLMFCYAENIIKYTDQKWSKYQIDWYSLSSSI